jgi:hypothetical protein
MPPGLLRRNQLGPSARALWGITADVWSVKYAGLNGLLVMAQIMHDVWAVGLFVYDTGLVLDWSCPCYCNIYTGQKSHGCRACMRSCLRVVIRVSAAELRSVSYGRASNAS